MTRDLKWFPHLPSRWPTVPLKAICDYRVSNVDKVPADGELPVRLCNYTDVYHHEFISLSMDLMQTTATQAEIDRFGLRVGDVIITKDSETWSDIGVPAVVAESAPDLVCGYHLAMLRPRPDLIDGQYLFRCLQARPMQFQFERSATGVTRFGLGLDAIGRLYLPQPPLPCQRAIADYLDTETAKIDEMIAAKERLLEILVEKRRALITHAVTRGLNPDAPTKDSGVEWLGDIPAHWRVVPLKYMVDVTSGSTPDKGNAEYWSGDMPWVSPKDMKKDLIDDAEDHVTDLALRQTTLARIPAGSVLIVIRGMILAHSFPTAVATREITINQDMKALRCRQGLVPEYLWAYFRGLEKHLVSLTDQSSHGTKKLDMDVIGATPVLLPPCDEQHEIVDAVRDQLTKVDLLASRLEESVRLLRERRSALIAAAVTGQIDVEVAA